MNKANKGNPLAPGANPANPANPGANPSNPSNPANSNNPSAQGANPQNKKANGKSKSFTIAKFNKQIHLTPKKPPTNNNSSEKTTVVGTNTGGNECFANMPASLPAGAFVTFNPGNYGEIIVYDKDMTKFSKCKIGKKCTVCLVNIVMESQIKEYSHNNLYKKPLGKCPKEKRKLIIKAKKIVKWAV